MSYLIIILLLLLLPVSLTVRDGFEDLLFLRLGFDFFAFQTSLRSRVAASASDRKGQLYTCSPAWVHTQYMSCPLNPNICLLVQSAAASIRRPTFLPLLQLRSAALWPLSISHSPSVSQSYIEVFDLDLLPPNRFFSADNI